MIKAELNKTNPELSNKITEDEIISIFNTGFRIMGELLYKGVRVIFEGYFSFYTNPVKRKHSHIATKDTWFTYKNRVRMKTALKFKKISESSLSEEEFLKIRQK